MKNQILTILRSVARRIPLGLYPLLLRRESIGVFYHAVSAEKMTHARHLYPVVPVERFEDALNYLRKRYQFVPYSLLHTHYTEGEKLPAKAVHLSFDDGFAECFSVARPLLLEMSLPCTFFLATNWIDNRAMFYRNKVSLCIEAIKSPTFELQPTTFEHLAPEAFETKAAVIQWLKELRLPDEALINNVCRALDVDWESFLEKQQPYLTPSQIQQMHSEGFTIGAHTRTHRKLKDISDAEIEEEIVASCRAIQEITGQDVVPFSFPHSAFGVDRGLLLSIRARYPFVGLMFDTKGVRLDEKFILNRVWAERPLPSLKRGSEGVLPLFEVLHHAYQEAWVDEIMGMGRQLRGK